MTLTILTFKSKIFTFVISSHRQGEFHCLWEINAPRIFPLFPEQSSTFIQGPSSAPLLLPVGWVRLHPNSRDPPGGPDEATVKIGHSHWFRDGLVTYTKPIRESLGHCGSHQKRLSLFPAGHKPERAGSRRCRHGVTTGSLVGTRVGRQAKQ